MDDFEVGDVVQRALDRLTLPAEATTALSSTLDSHNGLSRGCRFLVPQPADWAAVDLIEDDGRRRRISVVHHDPEALPVGGLTGCCRPSPRWPWGRWPGFRRGRPAVADVRGHAPPSPRPSIPCTRGSWSCSTSSVRTPRSSLRYGPDARYWAL
ncbi:hypothetical protein ABT065_35765 [Streptomyces sp. NPDC002764]|uniref:hypothetical protein n=1 Tax=Streptomyces sp. NPDC002764 TaxID=3154428 RepID=UPI0033258BDB